MRGALIAGLVLFGVGSCVGANTVSPEVDIVKIPGPTRVVHDPAPPAEIKVVLPDTCVRAIDLAVEIAAEGSSLYDKGTNQLRIMSKARQALVESGDLNVVDNAQRDLQGDTVVNLSNLSEALYKFELARDRCNEEAP